jgi:membrane protein implicated in regulation of membrane protease activity
MTRRLAAFVTFWYEFIVGDDWLVAVGVVCALALTWVLHVTTTVPVWWVLPAAVLILLPTSLWRMAHRRLPKPPTNVTSARTVVSVPGIRE